jgi:hypothetical protein
MHPVARVTINVYRNLRTQQMSVLVCTIKRAPTFVAYGGFYKYWAKFDMFKCLGGNYSSFFRHLAISLVKKSLDSSENLANNIVAVVQFTLVHGFCSKCGHAQVITWLIA